MKIKVCGITRLEDAELACRLGAWAVGFIFVPESPRCVSADVAARICEKLPKHVEKVGVFADAPVQLIREIRDRVGLTIVQLHGRETAEDARAIGGRIFKAVRAKTAADIDELSRFRVEAFLIDGPGKGALADWELAKRAKALGPVILAGGLTAANRAEAVKAVQPFAIDLSSSLETSPGVKNPEKLKEIFK